LNQQRIVGARIEEALLDVGALGETALLKFIAGLHRTRYVTTDKLARADINVATLQLVPKKIAEHEVVFPVLFDDKASVLSVVTPDPDDDALLKQVQLEAKVKQ